MTGDGESEGFGRLVVERSGGIGGFLLVWDLDMDAGGAAEEIGVQVAALPWSGGAGGEHGVASGDGHGEVPSGVPGSGLPGGADRYVYALESRFGRARFGESELSGGWRSVVDAVQEIAEPERRRPS